MEIYNCKVQFKLGSMTGELSDVVLPETFKFNDAYYKQRILTMSGFTSKKPKDLEILAVEKKEIVGRSQLVY